MGNGFDLTRPALFGSSPFMELSSFAPSVAVFDSTT